LPALVTDYKPERIDRASYRLRVGPEVYVSPTGEPDDPRNKPKTRLEEKDGFTVPAGQFGFILTEENVKVPPTAIAFISMRANYKFQGLVNVSGFHVDPNYDGRLIFSVFNAGPGPVHLSRGEECFLIFYADLDQPKQLGVKKGYDSIPSHLTGPIAGGLQSFAGLLSKIYENDKKLNDRVNTLEREQAVLKWAMALAVGALVAVGLRECSFTRPAADQSKAGISAPASPTPAPRTP
jgi:dCTP deaminase